MRADPPLLLARAVALIEAGRPTEALADVGAAVRLAPRDPAVRLGSAHLAFALGAYAAAMEHVDRALELAPRAAAAFEAAFQLRHRLGRLREAVEVAGRAGALGPAGAAVAARAAELLEGRQSWEAALPFLERALAAAPPSADLLLQAASLRQRLGQDDAARGALAEAARGSLDAPQRQRAAAIARSLGDFDEAEAHARAALERDPRAAAARVLLAELRLWAGDLEGALAESGAALRLDPRSAPALRVRGGVAVRRGRYQEAIAILDEAIAAGPPDAEAHVLRGEAWLRLGRVEEAYGGLDRGMMTAGGYYFAARALRLIGTIRAGEQPRALTRHGLADVREGIVRLVPGGEALLASEGCPSGEVEALLERALARLGGNRSPLPTVIDEAGRLRLVRLDPGARAASRRVISLVETLPVDEVLRRFDEVIAAYPESSLPLAHRGELFLWLGRYGEARRDLEGALAVSRYTRWAYIGLTLLECLEGRPGEALRVSERGIAAMRSTGTSVYVHRGEALRRAGDLGAAERDLRRACELHPTRLSAWVNLALVHAARGDREGTAALFERVRHRAAGLLADAAADLGLPPPLPHAPVPPDAQVALLEESLAMMKGNRASTLSTYITRDGRLRSVPAPRIADWREGDLATARAFLRRAARR